MLTYNVDMTQLFRWTALLLWVVTAPAGAQAALSGHAMTMFDNEVPKYPPGFKHFEYANPEAPKGGTLRLAAEGTFDSFHPFIPKGNPASTGSVETLLVTSADEPFTAYGLIAESMEWPEDRSWVIFNLRREARWHDGPPITATDVTWSFSTLIKTGRPGYRFYYQAVEKADALSPTLTLTHN